MMPTSGLDPTYAHAAMALNPGQTSGLVRSQFGYHIIQTVAKQPAHTKTLAEVHDSIVAALESQKAAAAAQNYANQLVTEARKDGLEKTAQAHNLHVVTTDYVGRDGVIPSLPDSTALLTAAFGVAKGAAPQSATTGEGYAIFQVLDVKAAHAPDFAAWKSHVLADYRDQKAPELLNAQLIKLADRAKVLNDLPKAAAEMKLPVKTSDLVGRDTQLPDLGSMSGPASVLFSLPKGGISGPINEGPTLGTVAQVVDQAGAHSLRRSRKRICPWTSREAPRAAAAGGLWPVRRIPLAAVSAERRRRLQPQAARRPPVNLIACVGRGPASRPHNAHVLRFRSFRSEGTR